MLDKLNCFAILFIPSNLENYTIECLNVNYCKNNKQGLRYYIEDVLKIDDYIIEYTILDFDHFKMLYEK